jgi:hypothetical protein
MDFKQFIIQEMLLHFDNLDLRNLLGPPSSDARIGHEKTVTETNDGICEYVSKEKSHRFVFKIQGQPVSVIQVMSKEKKKGIIANIYTLPEFRRNKLATKLYNYAKIKFPILDTPSQLSDLGQAWRKSVK